MRIGITGAGGNVGTTLRRGLADGNALRLFDLDRLSAAAGEESVVLDCADAEALAGAFDGLDALVHLAGDPRPNAPESSTLRNNVLAASLAFEEARRAKVRRIVFASSNFVHEGAVATAIRARQWRSIRLDDPPTARSLYGQSKVYGENVGRHLALTDGPTFVALRIGWTVPEDDPSRYGSDYMRGVFCSHRDLVGAFRAALAVDASFLAAYAVSANGHGVFELEETARLLGWTPEDDAERWFPR